MQMYFSLTRHLSEILTFMLTLAQSYFNTVMAKPWALGLKLLIIRAIYRFLKINSH